MPKHNSYNPTTKLLSLIQAHRPITVHYPTPNKRHTGSSSQHSTQLSQYPPQSTCVDTFVVSGQTRKADERPGACTPTVKKQCRQKPGFRRVLGPNMNALLPSSISLRKFCKGSIKHTCTLIVCLLNPLTLWRQTDIRYINYE